MDRKIRTGVAGDGKEALPCAVRRMAAALNNQIGFVRSAFSAEPQRFRRSGAASRTVMIHGIAVAA